MDDFKKLILVAEEASSRLSKWFSSIDWKGVSEAIDYLQKDFPLVVEKNFIELANKGWFVWEMEKPLGSYFNVVNSILENDYEGKEVFLTSYFENESGNVESKLIRGYPDREGQIKDAFYAHKEGLYWASIPTLLALSEGICRDHYPEIGLYSKHPSNRKSEKTGKPKTVNIFDNISPLDVWEEMVLKPLKVTSDVTKTIKSPTEQEQEMFNRHLIMHGNSKKYGHKINSLKAISLANFVHGSLTYIKGRT